ncbi:phage/plasmid primase, P4 family [Youngiibacter multivorans]|uniref:P4 family phage/plasmid primase-like protein n=1 Tax=Youngiibacter multivorans TaxID=937251 RepID=A0ABS4G8R5_9CLOT|nr:phage/plasmid primase, P4 family [Youngiibacter multivorans]MBP1920955.1 P4 family phage/plasmid primase-like protein [Youngiibacter multivorans]
MTESEKQIYQKLKLFPVFKAGNDKAPAVPKGTSWKDEQNHVINPNGLNGHAAYGLVCGEKSQIMVLDIDSKDKPVPMIIQELFEAAELTDSDRNIFTNTFTVKTPNNGYHLYFKYRPGLNNVNGIILKNVDFKTEGGYVIAPYSYIKAKDGNIKQYLPTGGNMIHDMPESLYKYIKNSGNKKSPSRAPQATTATAEEEHDIFAPLKGMKAGEGRNGALNKALYDYCKRKNIKDKPVIMALAEKINTEYFAEPEEGALKTAESVYKALSEPDEGLYYLYEDGGKERVNTALLAKYIRENYKYMIVRKNGFDQDLIYWYQGGYYKRISINSLKGKIKELIPEPIQKASMLHEVYQLLVTDESTVRVEDLDTDSDYINLKNGLYNVKTKKMEEHRSDLLSTIQINTDFNPRAAYPAKWDKFLNFLTDNDQELQMVLQEWAGLTISSIPGYFPKKALALYGPNGNNGKSVFINLLDYLIGTENIATRDIQDLSKPFATSDLYGKKALLIDDQKEADFTDSSIFKSITGGGLIACEFKGKQSFSYKFNGTVTFGCNELPYLSGEKGSHVFERLLIIPCVNVLQEGDRDPLLFDDLKDEIEGILLWALEGLHRLKDNNYKFTHAAATEMAREEYRMKSDSLYRFVMEEYIMTGNPADRVLKTQFETMYENWAYMNEIAKPIMKKNIKDRAMKMGIKLGKISSEYYMGIKPIE